MSTYTQEWDCCGSTSTTESWSPERCPFCEVDALRLRIGQTAALLDDGYHNDSTGVGYNLQSVMLAHRVAECGRVEPGAFYYDADDFSRMEGVYRTDAARGEVADG